MFKRNFNILSFALFITSFSFSQPDLQKQLAANKWYVNGSFVSKSMTFSIKPISKAEIWEARFLNNGKLRRCDSIHGSLFDKSGKETKMVLLECDSTRTYQIKNDIIHITGGANHYYYRTKSLPDKGFEFTPVKAEEFEKK